MCSVYIDLQKVVEWTKYLEAQKEGISDIEKMYIEAKVFLEFYNWCGEILEAYVGMLHIGIVGVFLFKIAPTRKDVDEWVWVIVGDIPPAYMTAEESPNPATALDSYIGAMSAWVSAAKNRESVSNLIPVNVPATEKNAELLKKRLVFLDERILSEYEADLEEAGR